MGARAKLLDHPLARALAEAEVADAAWFIDRDLAKQLLRDAYDLSSLGEDEQAKFRNLPAGSPPRAPRQIDTARWNVHRRIMAVARRDKLFADELTQPLTDKLGPYESQQTFAALAREALEDGDIDLGSKYIREAIDLIQLRATRQWRSVSWLLKIARRPIRRLSTILTAGDR